ncbi:PUB2, partial [Symbiodinium sp. CCMP2456]
MDAGMAQRQSGERFTAKRDGLAGVSAEEDKKPEPTPQRKAAKKNPDENNNVTKASTKEDIMAKTMFDMIYTVTLQNSGVSYRVLYATERQAQIIGNNPDTLQKLAEQFRTAEPKVVINLLTSLGTAHLRKLEADVDVEHRLDMFMRHVLLPIAEQTNALVLCDAVKDRCILADSFVRMCRVRQGAWKKKMPFTLLGFTTMKELDKGPGKHLWSDLMERCGDHCDDGPWKKAWKESLRNGDDYNHGHVHGFDQEQEQDHDHDHGTDSVDIDTWRGGDIQPLVSNVIIAGGLGGSRSLAAAAALKTALVSHLGASVPSIAFKTGMSELSHLQQTTQSGLETAVNAIQQQTSVIFLDLFPRDKLRPHSIFQAAGIENRKRPQQELPIRPHVVLAEAGQDRDEKFLEAAECIMRKGIDPHDKHNFFEGCAIAKLHWRYRTVFGEASNKKQRQSKFALWQAIRLEERNRETRDIDGVRQARSVLYRVFQKQAEASFRQRRSMLSMGAGGDIGPGQTHGSAHADGAGRCRWCGAVNDKEDDEAQGKAESDAVPRGDESKMYAFVARSTELVSSDLFASINIWQSQSALERKIYRILTRSRLPPQHNLEALRLLRDAWTEYDVAKHLATYYGRLSRLWYFFQIGCGLVTIVFNVIAETQHLEEFYTSLVNFNLSLFCTTLISLHAFANPTTRWHKLRCAAAELESLTWLFRTKCRQFELGDIDFESNSVTLFREQLNEWRRTVVRGTDLHRSDFQKKWPHRKLTRGQHEKSRIKSDKDCSVQKPADDEDMVEGDDGVCRSTKVADAGDLCNQSSLSSPTAGKKSRCSGGFMQLFCCGRTHPTPQEVDEEPGEEWDNKDDPEQGDKSQATDAEAPSTKTAASKASLYAWQDDHHSPANAEEYIRWRLQTMRRFYEKRLPRYAKYHRFIFALTLLGSMGCSIFAYIEFNSWVVVWASLSTAASSWMEFSNVLQNIQRYSDTIQELKKLEAWWESLPPMEKASKENLNLLV